ncbi:hypothetical protein QR680_016509 [Steinernema hermaphroditum]|uniref:G-protein coupled receptors family 1 profile domain-containing protein n=1 Tax=Steinernema hermaphroditum TaxID=289476 RepID=A0AA39HBF2_9BILA|nr:hypothetical protein QR680_016509 [Steinernema hermaphroditum]
MGCILTRFKSLRKRKPPIKSGYKSMRKSRTVTFNLKQEDKDILIKHWEPTILTQEPDLFLKTMMASIKDSPKLLDIISRKTFDPSSEHIAEWPKLQQMAIGNCAFFSKQIVTNRLDEGLVRKDSEVLGAIHIEYCAYGFKPTFLDIWQANMISIIQQCDFHPQIDKVNFVRAFSELSNFLCTLMVVEYEDSMQSKKGRYVKIHNSGYLTLCCMPGLVSATFFITLGILRMEDMPIMACIPPLAYPLSVTYIWITANISFDTLTLIFSIAALILVVLRKHQLKSSARHSSQRYIIARQKRLSKSCAVMLAVFLVVTFSQHFGMNMMRKLGVERNLMETVETLAIVPTMIAYSQSFYVYFWSSRLYRNAFKEQIRCFLPQFAKLNCLDTKMTAVVSLSNSRYRADC